MDRLERFEKALADIIDGYHKIGKELEVLVEGKTKDGKYYVCRSYMDVPDIDGVIYLETSKELKSGDFTTCTIKSSINEYDLLGN